MTTELQSSLKNLKMSGQRKIPALLCVCFLAFLPASLLGKSPIILDESMGMKTLGLSMDYYIDERGDLDIKTAARGELKWERSTQEFPGFGFTSAVYWLRFTLKNENAPSTLWYLEVAYPMLDSITLFESQEGGTYRKREQGDRQPFGMREVRFRNPIFIMNLNKGEEKTCYLRVQSGSSMNIPLQIWTPQSFTEHSDTEKIIMGLYYGSMIIMFIYHIFLFIGIRHRSYLFYVMYIISYILFQMNLNGIAFQYLWPNSIWWANVSLPFFMFFTVIWVHFFNRSFLNTKKTSPVFHRIYNLLIITSALGCLMTLVLEYAISIRLATLVVLFSVIMMLINSYLSMIRGSRAARIYTVAWTVFILGTFSYTLKTFGVLPNNFLTNWSIQIGSIIKVVLMSLALAEHLNILRQEKTVALKLLNEAYSRFVPHEFLRLLEKKSITEIKLGDQVQREITILFSDIRSFTSLSESMTPQENFNFLNSYLKQISPVIRDHAGFIDKFIGDAFMALFPEKIMDAVRASVNIQRELALYNNHRESKGYKPVKIGIGLHTGTVMLGTIGEQQRIDGTVIADAVNVTSRIEGLCKPFGSPILASSEISAVIRSSDEFHCRHLGRVKLKGKASTIEVYEVIDGFPGPDFEKYLAGRARFEGAVNMFFNKKFTEAGVQFLHVLRDNPGDLAASLYHARSLKFAAEGVPDDWVFEA